MRTATSSTPLVSSRPERSIQGDLSKKQARRHQKCSKKGREYASLSHKHDNVSSSPRTHIKAKHGGAHL